MSKRAWLVIAAAGGLGLAGLRLACSGSEPAPGAALSRTPGLEPRADDPAAAAIADDAAARGEPAVRVDLAASQDATRPDSPTHRFVGRVLDGARRPVARAAVVFELEGLAPRACATDAEGRFELDLHVPEDAERVGVSAHDGRGASARRALGALTLRAEPVDGGAPARVELDPLVLLSSYRLAVSVLDGAAPAADARLRVSLGHSRATTFYARTDGRGEVLLEHLPPGPIQLEVRLPGRGARATAFVPEDSAAILQLGELAAGLVRVRDASTGAPLVGVRVQLSELRRVPAAFPGEEDRATRGEFLQILPLAESPTDAEGHARFDDLLPAAQYRLRADAPGYAPFPRPPASGPRVTPGGEPVEIELAPLVTRSVRWPIVAGELPVPPDGTPIELAPPSSVLGASEPPSPVVGRMQGTTLVCEGLGRFHLWMARAPDGALARLWVAAPENVGAEASFRRPRRVEVRVRDAAGGAVAGAGVIARDQGNNAMVPPVLTDAEGRAVLEGLYGGLAGIHVDRAGGSRGPNVGQVDLDQGDGSLDVSLPGSSRARLALRLDGRPLLPARFRLFGAGAAIVRVRAEDPGRGELELEIEGADAGDSLQVRLTAPGFRAAGTTLEFPADGSPALGEISLEPSAVLHVRLAGERPEALEVVPERFDEEASAWQVPREFSYANGLRYPNGPADGFVFADLEPGRWRAFERESGSASSAAELLPGALSAEVTLQLVGSAWVSGRVELEDPAELPRVRVRVVGLETDSAPTRWMPGQQPPEGTWPQDGVFRIRVPKDRDLELVPWHPWLSPAADGTARVRGEAEGLVLRLVAGDELRLAVPQLAEVRRATSVRVARYAAGAGDDLPAEPLEWHHAPLVEGVARCALPRGTWTLWIDPGTAFRPLVLRDLGVEGAIERTAQFERGSALRVRVLVPPDQDPPRILVSARSQGGPLYQRYLNSSGEAEVLLEGLGPGRFDLHVSEIMGDRPPVRQTIDLDGRGDFELELDLR